MKTNPNLGSASFLFLAKKYLALPILILVFLASCKPNPNAEDQNITETSSYCTSCDTTCFSMNPLPSSFPVSASTIQGWVNTRNGHSIRAHGWTLFSDLMTEVTDNQGHQTWRYRTWPTATQAFKTENGSSSAYVNGGTHIQEKSFLKASKQEELSEQINLAAPAYRVPSSVCQILGEDSTIAAGCIVPENGCQFQNNGDILIAGVIYNEPAYDHIRGNGLYDWNTLKNLWTNTHNDPDWSNREIPTFPNKAVVLKPMLWPIKGDGDKLTPLPVFPLTCYHSDCDINPAGQVQYSGFEIQEIWNSAVAVSADNSAVGSTIPSIDFLYDVFKTPAYADELGPLTYNNVKVHGLDEFYHWKVGQDEWNAMDDVDKAIISQSANWAYGRDFKPGDHLALVAMHIITKEMPSWTFQTIWWDNTNQPKHGQFSNIRDTVLNPPKPQAFSSYLMMGTYGMNAKEKPNPQEWPIAFNPYIELAAAHPIQTNCRNCHQRAAFPSDTQNYYLPTPLEHGSSYLQAGNGFPNALDTFEFSNSVLDSLLIMDFQWAISDRVKPLPSGN